MMSSISLRCENRWVLIPDQGCEACDNCVHTLLDDTDDIQMEIANASQSLYIINIGVEARKRLEEINATTQGLWVCSPYPHFPPHNRLTSTDFLFDNDALRLECAITLHSLLCT